MGTPPSVTRVRFRSLVPIYFIARPANRPNTKAAASVTSVRRHGQLRPWTGHAHRTGTSNSLPPPPHRVEKCAD